MGAAASGHPNGAYFTIDLHLHTNRGSAEISINFDWGEDMVSAMLEAESEVNKILPSLPSGVS